MRELLLNPNLLECSMVKGDVTKLPDIKTRPREVYLSKQTPTILGRAGITDVRVHDPRHTFASHAIIKGAIPMVSKLLGHRKIAMALRYTHVSDQETEAAERVGMTL